MFRYLVGFDSKYNHLLRKMFRHLHHMTLIPNRDGTNVGQELKTHICTHFNDKLSDEISEK